MLADVNGLGGGSLFGRADDTSAAIARPDPTIASRMVSPSGCPGMVERDENIHAQATIPNCEPICLTSAVGSAMCTSGGGGGDGEVMRQLDEGLRSLRAEVASLSLCSELVPLSEEGPALLDAEPSSNATALLRLEEGLASLREEVAAVDALRGAGAQQLHCSPSARCAVAASSSSAPAPRGVSELSPPGGLPWTLQLSHHDQGRLAACRSAQEALEVLEEVLVDLAPDAALEAGQGPSSGVVASPSCHTDAPQEQARPELISASVELLKAARQRAKGFETELEERRKRHEEEVAELRRRHRAQRSRSLQRLMDRFVAPSTPESADAQNRGDSRRSRRDAQARGQPLVHVEQDDVEGVHSSSGTLTSPQGPKGFSDGSCARAASAPGAARRRLARTPGTGQGSLARDCLSPGPGDCQT